MKLKIGTLACTMLVLIISISIIYGCSKSSTAPLQQGGGNRDTGNGGGGGNGGGEFPGTQNVVYGTGVDWQGKNVPLTLDVYLPSDTSTGKVYPLVVFIHGGGFVSGDKAFSATKCQLLADSGFVAATINYRLGWDDGGVVPCSGDTVSLHFALYRAMQDVNAAFRFLVSHATAYHIDPNWVFAAGSSAGGVAALMSSYVTDPYASWRYSAQYKQLGSLVTADNNLTTAYSIKGICSISGCTEDSNLINSSRSIPAIFFHGTADGVVPVDHGTYLLCPNYPELFGSECLYRRLIATNTPVALHLLPGGGHGNNGESGWDNPFLMGNTACFFHAVMRKSAGAQTGIYVGLTDASCK